MTLLKDQGAAVRRVLQMDGQRPEGRGGGRSTFADVAGAPEALIELREVCDYLENPDALREAGRQSAQGSRYLTNPPGTGEDAARASRRRRGQRPTSSRCRARSSSSRSSAWARRACVTCSVRPAKRRPPSSSSTSSTPSVRQRGAGHGAGQRRARADAQPDSCRDGRVRRRVGCCDHGRDQPSGHPRQRTASTRPLLDRQVVVDVPDPSTAAQRS